MMSQYLTSSSPNPPVQDPWDIRYGTKIYKNPSSYNGLFVNVQRDLNEFFRRKNLTHYAVYPLDEDGVMGNATEVAVMTFQQIELNDSNPDGIVGPIVKENLYRTITGN